MGLIWKKEEDGYGLECYILDTPFIQYCLEQWEKSDYSNASGRHGDMNPDKLVWKCDEPPYTESKYLKVVQNKVETHYHKLVSQALKQLDIGLVLHEDEI